MSAFPTPSFDRSQFAGALAQLAERGVYLGTSSWKYPGWRGQIYDEARYVYRGKFSEARFERLCLTEYAEVFKSVCVDAAYYQFPSAHYVRDLMGQVPADFVFSCKVTDEITVKRFPNLPRFGRRAGEVNPNFLNAGLFVANFLAPFASYQSQVGLLMFEFSRFYAADFARGRDFVEALSGFLSQLPKGWHYGVEIRNPNFLQPDYFAALREHNVSHVFNSWDAMPSVGEQMAMAGSRTSSDALAARFLLKPGRKYEDAVKTFSPYDRLQEINEAGRDAAEQLLRESMMEQPRRKTFLYVNNRFEGNAIETILALLVRTQMLRPNPGPGPSP
jgi:uncharacterized protein YecE (DUF72 family)